MTLPPAPTLGVHPSAGGVDVAVLASHAEAVDLCLLDPDPSSPDGWSERRVALGGPVHGLWIGHVDGVGPGQHYGFRARGRWDPASGTRYNSAKLLLDPYARGVANLDGVARVDPALNGHRTDARGGAVRPLSPDPTDSRATAPHGVVVDSQPSRERTLASPRVPWQDTVIYEAHVRGLTLLDPAVPPELRGTYAGLAHPAAVERLRTLGVTTLELLPIHAMASEPHLVQRDLTNYWGYNTLAFFAPNPTYATAAAQAAGPGAVLEEVRAMVDGLHAAGLEVVLDVVYNHTCEGGTDGLHLSWRGLDPTVYYLHDGASPARFADVTGCGNSLDFRRPRVVQMALDSLRYWAGDVGVDGFRFDLAVTLGRGPDGFSPTHPFLVALQTDPLLSDRKLIAEPWDLGPGGWRTGAFPAPMAEWNDQFRNAARTFWLVDAERATHGRPGHGVRELATRLAGSADVFGHSDPPLMRGLAAVVNYVTAHDGFTLADLVAYEHKHNEGNGEGNRDGSDDNRSWNHGVEGPVRDPWVAADVLPLRRRSMRNLLGTLLLAAGTPMMTAGDETGRTQAGNNNAYCRDDEISWVRWDLEPWQEDLLATTRHLLALRRDHPALRATAFFHGRPVHAGDRRPDLDWRTADGGPFDHHTWHDPAVRTLQMVRITDDGSSVLLVINGALDQTEVTLADGPDGTWDLVWDSVWESPDDAAATVNGGTGLAPGTVTDVDPLSLRVYTAR